MSTNVTIQSWHGIPREEIDWFPTVVAERCIGCGLCVTTCGRKVYRFDYEHNIVVVTAPYQCMVGCSTCAMICPREAIEFPSRGFIQQVIREKKILRHSKDMLRGHPEVYGVNSEKTASDALY